MYSTHVQGAKRGTSIADHAVEGMVNVQFLFMCPHTQQSITRSQGEEMLSLAGKRMEEEDTIVKSTTDRRTASLLSHGWEHMNKGRPKSGGGIVHCEGVAGMG